MVTHDKQDIHSKVVTIIAQILNRDKKDIPLESSLEKLGADSLDMLEIIMKFEEAFNIEISDDAAERIVTINDAVEKIEALRKK